MATEKRTNTTGKSLINEVREDLAYFHKCIREAGPLDSPEARAAFLTYAPFLHRRFRLLSVLENDG